MEPQFFIEEDFLENVDSYFLNHHFEDSILPGEFKNNVYQLEDELEIKSMM